jgi:hypothetical protein
MTMSKRTEQQAKHDNHMWCRECGAEVRGNSKLCGGAACINLAREAGGFNEFECQYPD